MNVLCLSEIRVQQSCFRLWNKLSPGVTDPLMQAMPVFLHAVLFCLGTPMRWHVCKPKPHFDAVRKKLLLTVLGLGKIQITRTGQFQA